MDNLDELEDQVNLLKENDKSMQEEIRTSNEDIQQEIRALRERLAYVRPVRQEFYMRRQHVLEGRDEQPIHESSDKDAVDPYLLSFESARGGNIYLDCSVLKELREKNNSTELESCHRKFREVYGIEFEIIGDIISKASPSAIDLYNFRAHIRLLDRWKNAEGEKKTMAANIEKKCSEAISRWESWVKEEEPRTASEPDIDEAAREVRRLYSEYW